MDRTELQILEGIQLIHYGNLGMVGDLCTMRGPVHFDRDTSQCNTLLDEADHWASPVAGALSRLLKNKTLSINLGEIYAMKHGGASQQSGAPM